MTLPLPVQLLVLAKQPVPGRVKTRLSPALSPTAAAGFAAAALRDTLAAVRATPVARRVLVLDGDPAAVPCDGFDVLPQVAGGLGDRLAAAFEQAWAGCPLPLLLIGMDTPQVTRALLQSAARQLLGGEPERAVLGLAEDGGWWALGLPHPVQGAFDGVPMSEPTTGQDQRNRLTLLGLGIAELPVLRDVDHLEDIAAVAAGMHPLSAFAQLTATLRPTTRRPAASRPRQSRLRLLPSPVSV